MKSGQSPPFHHLLSPSIGVQFGSKGNPQGVSKQLHSPWDVRVQAVRAARVYVTQWTLRSP